MNKTGYLLVTFLFLMAGFAQPQTQSQGASLKFDGVYRASVYSEAGAQKFIFVNGKSIPTGGEQSSSSKYLRFYPDGEVLACTSTGKPKDLRRWFTKEDPKGNLGHGKYEIQGNHLSFTEVSEAGSVDCVGEIRGDQIIVNWHSRINNRRGVATYYFVNW